MSFEDRLRDRFQRASDSMPDVAVRWESTIRKARAARARRTALMAAAAVFVLGGAAWAATTLGSSGPAPGIPPAGDSTEEDSTESPQTPQDTPHEQDETERAVRTRVVDWVKALSLADADTAWSWLSTRTQQRFGNDIERFKQHMSAFSEGFGSWYSSDPRPETTFRPLVSSGEDIAGIVEIHGIVTKEGSEELGHDALPVRIVDGEVFVEPFSSDLELIPQEPAPHESYPTGEVPRRFRATGIGDVQQVNFFYHGFQANIDASVRNLRGRMFEANAPVPHGIEPGPHFLTVVVVEEDGGIATLVVPFFVE